MQKARLVVPCKQLGAPARTFACEAHRMDAATADNLSFLVGETFAGLCCCCRADQKSFGSDFLSIEKGCKIMLGKPQTEAVILKRHHDSAAG